jgi:Zn-dependent M28 family amino/carboxypeptidase
MTRRLPPLTSLLLVVLAMALATLACNLSDNAAPPTLVLRATATPPPTIGYATLPPEALPQQEATAPPRVETLILNLINQVQTDRLMYHVASLADMTTRHVNSPYVAAGRGIGAARDYILNELNQISTASQGTFRVLTQDFPTNFAGVTSIATNVIGISPGDEIGAGVIIVGAHYDSISINPEDGNAYAPGANDNASGVAALIEIARIVSQRRHRATIIFVAFSAEEIGREGSKVFVDQYVRGNNLDVRAMLNLDIIGSNTSPTGQIANDSIRVFSADPNNSPSRLLARELGLLARQYTLDMRVFVEPLIDREGRYSDHITFSDAGYPAARFIETLEDSGRQHTDRDTIDDVQPGYLTQNTRLMVALVTSLADGPRPPANITLRDDGNGLRTLLWDAVPEATAYIVAFRAPGAVEYTNSIRLTDIANRSVTWEGFTPQNFEALAIAAENSAGIVGPLSDEYIIVR